MMCSQGRAASLDERALWQLWVSHTNSISDHRAADAVCKAFLAKSPDDTAAVVVRGIEAWHLLKSGNTNEASALLNAMLAIPGNATSLQQAGATMARNWLTRLDRERVKDALKKVYRRDVEFPGSLEEIKGLKLAQLPPFTDRWDKPWVYRLESSLKGMQKQQYVLESSRLGSGSDLEKALNVPYASRINLMPVRASQIGNDTYEFATPLQKGIFLPEGAEREGIVVAYLGANVIVLSDGTHWRIALKPR